jgi:hypothetical protein
MVQLLSGGGLNQNNSGERGDEYSGLNLTAKMQLHGQTALS